MSTLWNRQTLQDNVGAIDPPYGTAWSQDHETVQISLYLANQRRPNKQGHFWLADFKMFHDSDIRSMIDMLGANQFMNT